MRKVRIGNDINVRWEVKTDGQAVSLEGKALKLFVRSAYRKEEITTFTVEGCVVSFTYPASMQRMTGARAVILEDATEGAPRRTVCADQAFTLVAHSCEESDDDVEFEDFMVSLQSNVLIGKPGLSAYEVWLSEGNTGTLEDWYAFLRKPATDIAADVAEAEAERKAAETARQEAEEGRKLQAEECKKQTDRAKAQADHPNIIGDDGSKYLHDNNLFGSGISSNDACNSENTWLDNGGVRCKEQGTAEWTYRGFGDNTPFGYNENLGKNDFSWFVNSYRSKEQCMESQMAASWAAEFGIAENTEYEAYGATYRYKNITGVKGLADGVMNCKVYRKKIGTCKGYKDANTLATYDLELSLRMSLIHGMNVSGDVFAYWGGGCEMVGTNKGNTGSAQLGKYYIDFYLEPNQSKWVNESVVSKDNLGTFGFEAVYSKISVFRPPILSDSYCKKRLGYTPYKIADGGNMSSWQCFYSRAFSNWSSTLNQRTRISVRLRSAANYAFCSARYLHASYSAATKYVDLGISAQCRIVQ